MDKQTEENRGKQVLVAGTVLALLLAIVVTMLMSRRFIPGWVGEGLGMVAGIMTTPFFMEATFITVGLIIVVGLNVWRRKKEGDEFVEIDVAALDAVDPASLEAALGAGRDEEVAAMLGRMDDRQFNSQRVLRVRAELAAREGDKELSARLRRMIGEA